MLMLVWFLRLRAVCSIAPVRPILFISAVSLYIFFFFSSRRRHTRCSRDWSSDVCSSDLAPLVDPAAITARLDAVEVLVGDVRGRDRLREALDGVRDVERLAGRAALGRATPRELGALRDSILRLPDVRAALDGLEARGRASLLEEAADRLDLLQDLGDELTRALVERPPAQASDGDAIRAGYDHELDELKDARDGGKQYIAGLQARERERTGI